ncbi:site-specific DNA-methyltransferase [Vibrio phage vB_VspS_VS-ABTNL-3]|nr:site-specific DNA-methyltransferase [Vibrio phage vB_VspS_VS-ABTNL-3]
MFTMLIKVHDIIVQDRQRSELDAAHVKKLAAAIKRVGLLHAIVLQDDNKTLVAGETRSRAVEMLALNGIGIKYNGEQLEPGVIPFTTLSECNKQMVQEAEFLENAMRQDLTWQDRDAATLKIKQLAEVAAGGQDMTPREAAQAIESAKTPQPEEKHVQKTRAKIEQAQLREEYKDDERVQKAKSAAEADRIIKKDLEKKQRAKLAEKFSEVETVHNIQFGDCCELIKGISSESIDVICADPIYGINANEMHMFQRAKYNEGSHHQYDDSWENWDRMFTIMPEELYRVAKEESACYLFCDITRFFDFFAVRPGNSQPSRIKGLATRMEEAGWTVWARPLVWYKGNIGSLPRPEHGPRYTTEYILFAIKGDKKTTGVYHDVINIPQTTGHDHAAGKPPAVYHNLLERSARPGDTVLDFGAGSFPILPAANALNCEVIAFELDEQWKPNAELRKTETYQPE